jgi:MFS family permease
LSATQRDQLDPLVWKVIAVAGLGSLLAQLDATIVNVSLSGLAQDLHATLPAIQWVTSGYLRAHVGASTQQLANRPVRRQGALPVVLLVVHPQFAAVRPGVVG